MKLVLYFLLVYLPVCFACEGNFEGLTCNRCVSGWTGIFCDVIVDDCTPNPCMHGGTCHNMLNDYRCECENDYWGKKCQVHPRGNECSHDNNLVDLATQTILSSEVRQKCSADLRANCFV